MLRATHSVLKHGAPNCFYVVTYASDLSDADRERLAEREGNEHVESPMPYNMLMEQAGFADIELTDVTLQYIQTIKGWKQAWEADAEALIGLVGEDEFARRMHNRTLDIAHAENGLVRRDRVRGTKP